jgi:hypothetical protein
MIVRYVLIIVVIIVALLALQISLLGSFRSNIHVSIDKMQSQVGWCMLYDCEKISYPSTAYVTEPSMEIGFDVGPEDLKFGEIPIGSNGKRFINIANKDESASKVSLVAFGNISSFIHFGGNNFVLDSEKDIEITIEFRTEMGMETGNYSGGVTLLRLSPKHESMNFLLGLV